MSQLISFLLRLIKGLIDVSKREYGQKDHPEKKRQTQKRDGSLFLLSIF
ncbi:hypothetical protein KGY73_11460 [bacterium]|nr:hypothetical protein [bacterium]